jgi:GT2 family glycosyltransferase
MDRLPNLFDDLLLPAAKRGVRVTVVDNASEPALRVFLGKFSGVDNLDIILNNGNSGAARGRNLGFKRSEREFVVCLDDDSIMQLDALERVPGIFDEVPEAGILAFRVVDGATGSPQNEHGAERAEVGNFHEAGASIRRAVFDRIGYLDGACFFGAEGIEFSMRAQVGGIKTLFIPEIVVQHFSFPRAGNERLQRRLYWVWGYALVLFRYLPPHVALLFAFRQLVSHLVSSWRMNKLAIPFIPPAMIAGGIRGLASRNPLSVEGVAFYCDPNTRPELGNVSITSKLRRRLSSVS